MYKFKTKLIQPLTLTLIEAVSLFPAVEIFKRTITLCVYALNNNAHYAIDFAQITVHHTYLCIVKCLRVIVLTTHAI